MRVRALVLWLPSCSPLPSSPIPSQPLRDDANQEGGDHATHREDGHGESPEHGEGAWWDGAGSLRPLPPQPRLIVALFNHLGDSTGVIPCRLLPLCSPPTPPALSGHPTLPAVAPHLLGGIDDPDVVAKLQGAEHSGEYGEDQGPSDSLLGGLPILGRRKQRGGISHGIMASFLPPGAQAQQEP